MKRMIVPFVGASLLWSFGSLADVALKSERDKMSYSMGIMTGRTFKNRAIDVNFEIFNQGMKDGYYGRKSLMTDEQIQKSLMSVQKQSADKMLKAAENNAKKSEQFLESNKNKPGVKTLPDGLQYKVLASGSGDHPKISDTVAVDYEGRLINGQVFDSSYQRGKPADIPLTNVIKGWQEALTMMRPGDKWEIYIPPQLAYGPRGVPGVIGGNEVLIFKLHLISIQKKK